MMEKIINNYLQYLKDIKNLDDKTIKSYLPAIKEMIEYCGFKSIDDINNSDVITLQSWINKKQKEGLGSQSINRRIASAKSFFGFLIAKRHISFNPAKYFSSIFLRAEPIRSYKALLTDCISEYVSFVLISSNIWL